MKNTIDLVHAQNAMNRFLNSFEDREKPGFRLKVVHTYHVVRNARKIAEESGMSEEDVRLAMLIGLLHDIGRFTEISDTGRLDNERYDHAEHGADLLFGKGMIRDFIETDAYDDIIECAVRSHNKLRVPDGLTEEQDRHARLIRDADKLDNFRVKAEEPIEEIFPNRIDSIEEINDSYISEAVMGSFRRRECVNIYDRKTPLDYMMCILAFVFDLNFDVTKKEILVNGYIEKIIGRVSLTKKEAAGQLQEAYEIIVRFLRGGSAGSGS